MTFYNLVRNTSPFLTTVLVLAACPSSEDPVDTAITDDVTQGTGTTANTPTSGHSGATLPTSSATTTTVSSSEPTTEETMSDTEAGPYSCEQFCQNCPKPNQSWDECIQGCTNNHDPACDTFMMNGFGTYLASCTFRAIDCGTEFFLK